MKRAYLFGGLVCCSLTAIWSCGLDDTAVVSIDDHDAAQSDGAFLDGAGDSSNDTGIADSGSDVTVIDSGPCPVNDLPTCDNGICGSASQTCTPPIPAGWHVTNLNSASTCDPAYGGGAGAKPVVEITDGGPASCACNCASTGDPSCANVHVDIGVGTGATCNAASQPLDMTANCSALGLTLNANSQATVSVSKTATCSGTVAPTIPTIDGGLATACDLNSDAGEVCATHRACVPKPSSGHTCIAQAGAVSCPTGFTYPFQATVASSYTDSRNCSACSCGFNGSGCTNPIVKLYPAAACGGTGTPMSQATCEANGAGLSVGVTGTNANPCVQNDGGILDGGTTVVAPETVCCAN